MNSFQKRAAELGHITAYEADGEGRIYAVYENGEVLPVGLILPSLAGKSKIPLGGFAQAVEDAMGAA